MSMRRPLSYRRSLMCTRERLLVQSSTGRGCLSINSMRVKTTTLQTFLCPSLQSLRVKNIIYREQGDIKKLTLVDKFCCNTVPSNTAHSEPSSSRSSLHRVDTYTNYNQEGDSRIHSVLPYFRADSTAQQRPWHHSCALFPVREDASWSEARSLLTWFVSRT